MDINHITNLPLVHSVPFRNEFLGEGFWVQLGNPANGSIMLMPYDNEKDYELVKHVEQLWVYKKNKTGK